MSLTTALLILLSAPVGIVFAGAFIIWCNIKSDDSEIADYYNLSNQMGEEKSDETKI